MVWMSAGLALDVLLLFIGWDGICVELSLSIHCKAICSTQVDFIAIPLK